jgi:hypothetical protein
MWPMKRKNFRKLVDRLVLKTMAEESQEAQYQAAIAALPTR